MDTETDAVLPKLSVLPEVVILRLSDTVLVTMEAAVVVMVDRIRKTKKEELSLVRSCNKIYVKRNGTRALWSDRLARHSDADRTIRTVKHV